LFVFLLRYLFVRLYILLKLYLLLSWLFARKWWFFLVFIRLLYISLSLSIESRLFLSIFRLLFEFTYWSLLILIFSLIIFTNTIFSAILSLEHSLFFSKTHRFPHLRSIITWILIYKILHFIIIIKFHLRPAWSFFL
jgi:hypothetical protein